MSELKRTTWGPSLWSFLHTTAAALDDPEAFVALLHTLPRVLPCPECREHSRQYLEQSPPEVNITDVLTASRYLYDFHNAVNVRLGKPAVHARVVHQRHGVLLPEAVKMSFSAQRIRPYRII